MFLARRECASPWSGPGCSFLLVQAAYETEDNGGGGGPAIWVSLGGRNNIGNSRIIKAMESGPGTGSGVLISQESINRKGGRAE